MLGCRGRVLAHIVEGGEDQAGLTGADLVGGEAPDYFVDGVLEVLLAGGEWEVEAVTATAAGRFLSGLAGGVVVVAEGFAPEGG